MSLSLVPVKLSDLPDSETDRTSYDSFVDSLVRSSDALINSLAASGAEADRWKHRKLYTDARTGVRTETFTRADPPSAGDTTGRAWHARKSFHRVVDETTSSSSNNSKLFDQFKRGLYEDHSKHEQEYIESLKSASLVRSLGERNEVYRLEYALPFPTKDRAFVELVLAIDTSVQGKRQFRVISLPVSEGGETKDKFVRGKYVSVEQVTETPGGIEWLMATASDPGGSIPRWVSEMAMPGKIAEDVPSFIEWIRRLQK